MCTPAAASLRGRALIVMPVLPTLLSGPAALALLVFQMLFIPCIATVAAMKQESGSWKWTAIGVGLLLVLSLAAGIAVYQIGSLL